MTHFRGLRGLYLVVSPILPFEQLLLATERALDGGVDILQLSASKETEEINALASALVGLAKKYDVPFLVNNNLELAAKVKADGVHFDTFDVSPKEARQVTGKECIVGYTVNVDLEKIKWAEQEDADYVSFCSIFHQCPGGICPIVPFDEVKNAKTKANIPVFAAGGINLENVFDVLDAGVDGVVVTSAILKSKDPKQTAKSFKQIINRFLEK
jgi:thiamine-phosphate pyrophosphorylase